MGKKSFSICKSLCTFRTVKMGLPVSHHKVQCCLNLIWRSSGNRFLKKYFPNGKFSGYKFNCVCALIEKQFSRIIEILIKNDVKFIKN